MEKTVENMILDEIRNLSDKIDAEIGNLSDKIDTEIGNLSNKMDEKFDAVDKKFDTIDKKFDAIENDLRIVKKSTLTMEHEHGSKIQYLLDICSPIFNDHIALKVKLAEFQETLDMHSLEIEFLKDSLSKHIS